MKFLLEELEEGKEHDRFMDIGWFCEMPEREFFFGVDDDMISEAPEEADLFFIWFWEDNHGTEPGIG